MSTQGTNPPIDQANEDGNDPIKQLKGESNRKFEKLSAQMEALQRANETLVANLTKLTTPPPPQRKAQAEEDQDLDSMFYSSPSKAAAIIKQQAKQEITEELNRSAQANQRVQSVINDLAREYPELSDMESELTKKSVEILNTLPEHERTATTSYRLAVKSAAEELAIKPRSKREPDDFIGGGYSNSPATRRRDTSDKKILSDITPIAEALGVNMSDPARQKRIVERAKRGSWQDPVSPFSTKKGRN